MSTMKPKAVFFTGTNGSGKSTMRESLLKNGEFSQEFVHIDPDKIARDINPDNPRAVDMEAGRLAIGRFNQAITDKCQRQFKFDPFGYEFGNLNLTPHLLNITHAW